MIVFNGRQYNSVEEMPPEVRREFEQMASMLPDENHNGTPDVLESDKLNLSLLTSKQKIVVQGKTYNSLDELPPEMRDKIERAMASLPQKETHSEMHLGPVNISINTRIVRNGRTINSIDEMPPEVRKQVKQVMPADGTPSDFPAVPPPPPPSPSPSYTVTGGLSPVAVVIAVLVVLGFILLFVLMKRG